jgi:hypothetical protein
MEQNLSAIYQGYHMMVRDYGEKLVSDISGLPNDGT